MYAVDAEKGEEVWRFATSTLAQSYAPPPYESFEVEIKRSVKEDEEEEEKYSLDVLTDQEMFGEHFYTPSTEYKTKSEYK